MIFLRIFKKSSNSENKSGQKDKFWLSIIFVILIKAILITIIWYVSFSDPIIEHLDIKAMDNHLLK